jgi:hypothetical protein
MSGLPGSRHLIAGKLALIDADRLVLHSFRRENRRAEHGSKPPRLGENVAQGIGKEIRK